MYAQGHDRGMNEGMTSLLEGLPGDPQQQHEAEQLATLPMRMGGLGLRSASRMAPAAYWVSWADCFPMIQERLPGIARFIVEQLESEEAVGCLGSLQHSAEGSQWFRGLSNLGVVVLQSLGSGSTVGNSMRLLSNTTSGMPSFLPSHLSRTRLTCGLNWDLEPVPCCVLQPDLFRTVVLERLRLLLQINRLDQLARICRAAGGIVRQNVLFWDMNITVSALKRTEN